MKLVKDDHNDEVKMDMTPLIDCVFLLILFFVLTSQITVNLEEVELPFALEGKEDDKAAKGEATLVINIVPERDAKLAEAKGERAGRIVYAGNDVDAKKLTEELLREARYDGEPPPMGRGNGYEPGPSPDVKLSKLPVIIRCDRSVRSEYTRTVFDCCRKAGIYKLKVSTVKPE